MKQFTGVLIFCFVFCSCNNKEKMGSDVITEKQMTEVMWDLMRVDQYIQDLVVKDTTKKRDQESQRMYDQVFALHHITAEQFKKSQDWYQSDPVRFRPIIDSLAKKQVVDKPVFKPINADTSVQHVGRPKPVKVE